MRNFSSSHPHPSLPTAVRRLAGRLPALVVLPAALLLGAPPAPAPAPVPVPTPAPAPGSAAARDDRLSDRDFRWELRALDGTATTLEAFRGKVLFVNLWATWCPPCVAELASIQALADSLAGDADVAFLLVSPETARPVRRFVARRRITAPVYIEESRAPARFGAVALPTTVVIDRDGRIVLRRRGAADWDDPAVRAFLRELAR